MEYNEKELSNKLNISQPALHKALKNLPFLLKIIDGSTKKVKHYRFEDLPKRYKDILIEKGEVKEDVKGECKTVKAAAFSGKYLLASYQQQLKAQRKCKLIEYYLHRRGTLNQEQWLKETLKNNIQFDELGNVTVKQLNDWIRKYKECKAKGLNTVESFVDARGRSKGVFALNEQQKVVAQRYFLRETRPKVTEVYRNMCHDFGDTMPSYDALNQYYKEWKIQNPVLYEMSVSPDSAKNKYLAAYGDMSEKAKYKNHFWELDSTPADVICDDGKRYTLLAAIDIYTRRTVYHLCESSSSFTISQLLRKAILKLGIPENVVIDNGKDYTSNHFQSICTALGINMIIVPPFSGDCKPFVERVFGTLSRELFEQIPGYIGHNVAQKEEIQARQSFRQKIESQKRWREIQRLKSDEEKKAWKDAWKLKKENRGLNLNILMQPQALETWINKWNTKIYEQRVHGGIKTKPILKWNQDATIVQSISDIRMLDLLLGESFTRKVGKKGISLDGCDYMHDELIEHTGKSVYVMAPDELGYILVYDMSMNYICIAEDPVHMGESRSTLKNAKKKSARWMRQLNKIIEEAQEHNDTTILTRIDAVEDVIESTTYAVQKDSPTISMLKGSIKQIALQESQELEKSNRYDFKNKDDEGKATKVLQSGRRPLFQNPYERFVWCLEHNVWSQKDEVYKQKHQKMYELAYKDVKGA